MGNFSNSVIKLTLDCLWKPEYPEETYIRPQRERHTESPRLPSGYEETVMTTKRPRRPHLSYIHELNEISYYYLTFIS